MVQCLHKYPASQQVIRIQRLANNITSKLINSRYDNHRHRKLDHQII